MALSIAVSRGGNVGGIHLANIANTGNSRLCETFTRIDNEALLFQLLIERVEAVLRRVPVKRG